MKCANVECWLIADTYIKVEPDCKVLMSEAKDHKECLNAIEGDYCTKHAGELLKQYSEYLLTGGKKVSNKNENRKANT